MFSFHYFPGKIRWVSQLVDTIHRLQIQRLSFKISFILARLAVHLFSLLYVLTLCPLILSYHNDNIHTEVLNIMLYCTPLLQFHMEGTLCLCYHVVMELKKGMIVANDCLYVSVKVEFGLILFIECTVSNLILCCAFLRLFSY